VYLHRCILNLTDPSVKADHLNGNGLDNRRVNLRVCSPSENNRNRRKRNGTSSVFKGVSWHRRERKWHAQIQSSGKKKKHLGYFTDEVDAAMAYDDASRFYFKAFAHCNFPEVIVEVDPVLLKKPVQAEKRVEQKAGRTVA
jgi:hypothetical protein